MEVLVILVVALIVLGPEKLPGVMRSAGKALGELRRASTEFQRTMNTELAASETKEQPAKAEEGSAKTLSEESVAKTQDSTTHFQAETTIEESLAVEGSLLPRVRRSVLVSRNATRCKPRKLASRLDKQPPTNDA